MAESERMLARDPLDFAALLNAGVAHIAMGQFDRAISRLSEAARLDPENERVPGALGYAFLGADRPDEAIAPLTRALEISPGSPQIREMLAEALAGTGKRAEAITLYRALIDGQPDNPNLTGRLGRLLADEGKSGEAITLLRHATGRMPGDFLTQRSLGKLVLETGGVAAAEPQFNACVDIMLEHLKAGDIDMALQLENSISVSFVRPSNSEDYWAACFRRWSDPMIRAGRAVARQAPPYRVTPSARPVVGVFLHQGSTLAHVETLLSTIEGMGRPDDRRVRPRIYVFRESDDTLKQACRRLDLPLIVTDEAWDGPSGAGHYFQRFQWLRERFQADGVEALVWISDPTLLSFASAMRLAPVQIWWAMRYHPIRPPDIDGYLTIGPLFQDLIAFHGQDWRVHPLVVGGLLDGVGDAAVAAIRSRFAQYETILGTFARSEKLASPLFLEGVCLTLKANPGAVFLWSGQIENPLITEYFQNAGVAERCHYMGWVNTAEHATAIDIFLDTAPAGCGVTAMEAMAAGKPVVAFDADWTMWGENVTPVLNGEVDNPEAREDMAALFAPTSDRPLLSRAESPEAYAAFATRIIQDKDYRQAVGEAGRIFCDRYLGNIQWNASIVTDHLLEIIQEARGKASAE